MAATFHQGGASELQNGMEDLSGEVALTEQSQARCCWFRDGKEGIEEGISDKLKDENGKVC